MDSSVKLKIKALKGKIAVPWLAAGAVLLLMVAVAIFTAAPVSKGASSGDSDAAQNLVSTADSMKSDGPSVHEPSLLYRTAIAGLYIAVLAGFALLVARWKKASFVPGAKASDVAEMIVIKQRIKASAQLTLLIIEVEGKRFMIAASGHAISTTALDKSDAQ